MTLLDELLARPAFAAGGERIAWGDVIAATRSWGDWEPVERAAAAGLAARSAAIADLAVLAQQRVTRMRRERRLLSADDTVAWLAMWGIEMEEWLQHVRQQVLAEHVEAPIDPTSEPAELARAEWIEGATTGALARAARLLAERRAAWIALGSRGVPEPEAVRAAAEQLRREEATPERIAELVASRRLQWTRLDLAEAVLDDAGAAQEVVYCVRDDRRDLPSIASEAGVEARRRATMLVDLPSKLQPRMAAAATGDVVGPVAVNGAYHVVVVVGRAEPSLDDPAVAERARALLIRRALARELSRHVQWLDPVLGPGGG